jgi:hypothetical protein
MTPWRFEGTRHSETAKISDRSARWRDYFAGAGAGAAAGGAAAAGVAAELPAVVGAAGGAAAAACGWAAGLIQHA